MKWSVQELNKFKDEGLTINEVIDLQESLKARDTDVLAVSPVHVTGHLTVNSTEYIACLKVKCTVTLPSTRSLTPVEVPISFDIDEVYMTPTQFASREPGEDDDLIMVLEKDLIDLSEAVEDYVLLNIPLQILTEEEEEQDTMPEGQDWEVISEEEFQRRKEASEDKINPQMAQLKTLLEEDSE